MDRDEKDAGRKAGGYEKRKRFYSSSGLEIKSLYGPDPAADPAYSKKLNRPGSYPYTRGIHPEMYRRRLWTMRQYTGFGSAEEANARFRFLLDQGQFALSAAFDLPTQVGYDSDHPLARGEVGKGGLAIDSLADMETLFEGIPLDRISLSMTINAPAPILLAMYSALAEKRRVRAGELSGTVQNDILKEYAARGAYIFPPRESMRLAVDTIAYAVKKLPRFNPISISGYHMREAGATAVQELAFTFANAAAYVTAILERGLKVDRVAPLISFFLSAHSDFFEEVAKFRAARRIWARMMKERFGAKEERSLMFRFHSQTAGSTLTTNLHDLNMVRVAFQALSAVLGGTQSLHASSRDEAFALPSEQAVLQALRTQSIIVHETGAANTADPLGGSYYLEALTDQIEDGVNRYLEEIESMGGAISAIQSGYIQREIHKSAYRYQKELESEERIVVGLNYDTGGTEPLSGALTVNPVRVQEQIERLQKLRKNRNHGHLAAALQELRMVAQRSDNLMPCIVGAVKAYATVGEICGILREVFGEYRPASSV